MVVFNQWFVLHLSIEYWNYNEKTWWNTLRNAGTDGMGSLNTAHNRRYGHPKGPHILPIWAAHGEMCRPCTVYIYIYIYIYIYEVLIIYMISCKYYFLAKACHYTTRNKAFTVYCYSHYILIIMWCYWLTDWLTDRSLLCSSILYVLKQIHCAQMFISSAHRSLFLCVHN